jgi:ubiquinone/menaquinone biosynthesis C-methylase UbiE
MNKLSKKALQQKYDQAAHWYDVGETMLGWLGVGRLRQKLLQKASGKVLEVAVGTGKNLPHYPGGCNVTAIDLSPEMLNVARKRADRLDLDTTFYVMDAEALNFPDGSFDTVVSTLSTCTFPDPVKALQEMARVCHPDGKVLLLEHGRSSHPRLARFQDRRAEGFAKPLGCHWNREPLELVRHAGLSPITAQRTFFGVLHTVEAIPPK